MAAGVCQPAAQGDRDRAAARRHGKVVDRARQGAVQFGRLLVDRTQVALVQRLGQATQAQFHRRQRGFQGRPVVGRGAAPGADGGLGGRVGARLAHGWGREFALRQREEQQLRDGSAGPAQQLLGIGQQLVGNRFRVDGELALGNGGLKCVRPCRRRIRGWQPGHRHCRAASAVAVLDRATVLPDSAAAPPALAVPLSADGVALAADRGQAGLVVGITDLHGVLQVAGVGRIEPFLWPGYLGALSTQLPSTLGVFGPHPGDRRL